MEETHPRRVRIFISHAHKDAVIASYLEGLLTRRFGDTIEVFNTSRTPLADVPTEEGVTGYQMQPVSNQAIPGVSVREPTPASAAIRHALDSNIAGSAAVIAIVTQRSV